MIGDMISRVRQEKNMTKTELARLAGIDIGHLTHIEKGERNPSYKTLKSICNALHIPYQQLMYTYGKSLNEDKEELINHISYDKILAVDKLDSFIECPPSIPSASLALKMPDSSMEPLINNDEYIFIEFNSPLENGDIGLFCLGGNFLIRKFYNKNNKIILESTVKGSDRVVVENTDVFYIIGKVFKRN